MQPCALFPRRLLSGFVCALAGCSALPMPLPPPMAQTPPQATAALGAPVEAGAVLIAHHGPASFAGLPELSAEAVVEQVLARNPSLAQMVAVWQAAQA